MDLKKAVMTRKSVKYFTSQKADWRKIIQAIDYARFAPAADNQFINKFILIQDRDKIEKIASAAQQGFIEEASFVVVVVSDPRHLVKLYNERGERFTAQQSGAAIENFLLALNERGLASGWIGHFSESIVKDLLQIPEELTVEAIFPIGKESKARKALGSNPIELEDILFFDEWKNRKMVKQRRVSVDHL